MVTNQDGLGTASHPEEFLAQLGDESFENEGVVFSEVLIDNIPPRNAPTRKPSNRLLTNIDNPAYDLQNSFVIGTALQMWN
jgi:imidazoleglycerol-phosphate dehydratase/histidinol-phosphatase